MTLKSNSRLVATAALALCVAGSALAQDRRNDDRPDRNGYQTQPDHRADPRGDASRERQNFGDRRGPNERQDYRDQRGFRERQDFREGRQ
ncbi:MAG: hypothetical protein JWQ03_1815, partial [Variovorax sp.]|nr:hypothetical protein [Variovorax sp.]